MLFISEVKESELSRTFNVRLLSTAPLLLEPRICIALHLTFNRTLRQPNSMLTQNKPQTFTFHTDALSKTKWSKLQLVNQPLGGMLHLN